MKRDLYFRKPLMNAAGTLGFSPDFRSLAGFGSLDSFGAFVVHPVSLRPRLPASAPQVVPFPGGFLLHTGLPNPGFSAVLKKHRAQWERAETPVIVHLMAENPGETREMTLALETLENVMAAELGFAPQTSDEEILQTLEACRGEIPLIFSLPEEKILSLGAKLIQRGAEALGMSAPRGSLTVEGNLVSGRLYGRALFPRALEIVRAAARAGLPLIASGGVWSEQDAADMLSAGALAVQLDAVLWKPRRNENIEQG